VISLNEIAAWVCMYACVWMLWKIQWDIINKMLFSFNCYDWITQYSSERIEHATTRSPQ
jgi:hypothetical protein